MPNSGLMHLRKGKKTSKKAGKVKATKSKHASTTKSSAK